MLTRVLCLLLIACSVGTVFCSTKYGYYAFKAYLPSSTSYRLLWEQQSESSLDSLSGEAAAALGQLLDPATARLVAMQMLAHRPIEASTACGNQTSTLLMGIATGKPWALTFLDADAKPPAALTYGGLIWLGSYDLCMTGAVGPSGGGDFHGEYCLTQARINGSGKRQSAGGLASPLLHLGLCWPNSCSNEQAANITQMLLSAAQLFAGANASLEVVPDTTECKVARRELVWTTPAILMLTILGLFASLVLAGTLYDVILVYRMRMSHGTEDLEVLVNEAGRSTETVNVPGVREQPLTLSNSGHRPGLSGRLLLCFSAYTNAAKIFDVSHSDGTLTCVHGLRFISMLWVILGHTYYFAFGALNNMGQLYTSWQNDWTFQVVANATVAVDSFFVLSGLLSTVLFFRELDRLGNRLGRVNWLMFYVHRYWRLTPPYLLIMASYVCLFQYVYEGPLYPQKAAGIDPYCSQYWWMNALYVNNLVAPEGKQCMAWSWYLANDMQFYAISPLFLVLLARWPPVGIGTALAALLVSVTGMGIYSSLNGLRVGFFGIMQEFSGVYIRPWFRAPPYLVGMLVGYALHRLPGQRGRLAWPARIAVWLAAASVALSVVYGLYNVDGGRQNLSQGVASLYNAVYRPVWGLTVAWVTFACVTGNGGWANRLLSMPALAPLSRLTYCAYLVHPVAMMAYYLSRRQAMVWDNFSVLHAFLSNAVSSYALAFIASLMFESPLIGLERVLRGR